MKRKKILIVEDDKMICTIFTMFINELGYELVGIASNGTDAITKAEALEPDVILMDIHLQGDINGIQATGIIRDKLDIPVIFVSSDMEDETLQKAILANTYGFLVKPIYKTALGVTIEFAYYKHKLDIQLHKTRIV